MEKEHCDPSDLDSCRTAWEEKEAELLAIAKAIFQRCRCSKEAEADLATLGDDVYDLMCEDCWEKFRKKEEGLKQTG